MDERLPCLNLFGPYIKRTMLPDNWWMIPKAIHLQMDKGNTSLLMLLDLSAALDTVIALRHLEGKMGLEETVLRWFHSFSSDFSQKFAMGGAESASIMLTWAVSPTWLKICGRLLNEIVHSFAGGFYWYADNIYISESHWLMLLPLSRPSI